MGVSLVGENVFSEENSKVVFFFVQDFLCISKIILILKIIIQIRKLL